VKRRRNSKRRSLNFDDQKNGRVYLSLNNNEEVKIYIPSLKKQKMSRFHHLETTTSEMIEAIGTANEKTTEDGEKGQKFCRQKETAQDCFARQTSLPKKDWKGTPRGDGGKGKKWDTRP